MTQLHEALNPMAARLVLAPAASGKTHACLERVRSTLQTTPLTEVWAVLPDRTQAVDFRRRLAEQGGALGAHVGTFGDLYAELLALADRPIPVAPEPVLHRLVRGAIDILAAQGKLQHYLPIQRRPGFVLALNDLIAELKRSRIEPPQFTAAVHGRGKRLEELAALYTEYQESLIRLGWADPEGLGWLAVEALKADPTLPTSWRLLITDGFDSFNPTQLETLSLLSRRVEEILLTLSGEPGMARTAHRRFARTLAQIEAALAPQIETLERAARLPPALAHLEASLFNPKPGHISAGRNITFIEAQTAALEARESLRWLKARIVRDRVEPEKCAVIARDLSPYRPYLREAAREFGMPLRFADSDPLARNPAMTAALGLLELTLQHWARRPLLAALGSPYFDLSTFGLSASDARRLDEAARWGQVIEGLDQWEEALQRLAQQPARREEVDDEPRPPRPPTGAEAEGFWKKLSALARRVTPPEKASLVDFVEWVEDLLSDETGLGLSGRVATQKDTVARDQAALVVFREVLRALVLADSLAGQRKELAYAEFYAELRGATEAATYIGDDARTRRGGRIYAASLSAARGVPYRAVAVLGLSEGLFPAPLAEDPFLSDEERASLQEARLPLEPRLRSDQQTLFYEAVTRATEYLLLTRPYLADDGERWEPSPYWTAALSLFDVQPRRARPDDVQPHANAASGIELLAGAVRARSLPRVFADLEPQWAGLQHAGNVLRARIARDPRGGFEGQLDALSRVLAGRYGPAYVWSASRLETYGACGYRFFVASALGLEPREAPAAGYDVAQLGVMLHAILERVYQAVADPTDVEAVVTMLPRVAQEVFDSAPVRYGFRPTPLWDAQRDELLEVLENTLHGLAEESKGFKPIRFEAQFGMEGSPPLELEIDSGTALFHGVIDRVDRDGEGGIRIIDYKTGASGLAARDLGEGRRLQLALYALAAERTLDLGRLVDAFYWGILKGEPSSLRLERFSFQADDGREFKGVPGAIRLVTEHVGTHVEGIRSGQFLPIPPRGGCPDYCPAKLFCWRYIPSD